MLFNPEICSKSVNFKEKSITIVENPYITLFQRQQAYQFEVGNSAVKARLQKLNRLKAAL